MTTPRIERSERTNMRSWRALGLRVLAVAGFATAAWLLSGSAAQADSGNQSDHNVASAASAAAPLGGLLGQPSNLDSVAGLAPVAQTMNTATQPVLDVTSDVLGTGSKSDRTGSVTTNQVVSALARTTQGMVSTVVGIPAEMGKTPILTSLTTVVDPVTNAVRPLTGPFIGYPGMRIAALADPSSRLVAAATSGLLSSPSRVDSRSVTGGSFAVRKHALPEKSSDDHDLVMSARDVTHPVAPRLPLPTPAPSGLGTGPMGNTGNLFGSQQDGGSVALVPASVTSGSTFFGALPVMSFIGISRDSAADPMVSPD